MSKWFPDPTDRQHQTQHAQHASFNPWDPAALRSFHGVPEGAHLAFPIGGGGVKQVTREAWLANHSSLRLSIIEVGHARLRVACFASITAPLPHYRPKEIHMSGLKAYMLLPIHRCGHNGAAGLREEAFLDSIIRDYALPSTIQGRT